MNLIIIMVINHYILDIGKVINHMVKVKHTMMITIVIIGIGKIEKIIPDVKVDNNKKETGIIIPEGFEKGDPLLKIVLDPMGEYQKRAFEKYKKIRAIKSKNRKKEIAEAKKKQKNSKE